MTKLSRQVNAIKEKAAELADELFSFLRLIILTSVEALFLLIFLSVHERVDNYMHNLKWCPLKVAIIIMGLFFLSLNLAKILELAVKQALEMYRNLRSAFVGRVQKTRTRAIPIYDVDRPRGFIKCGAGSTTVSVTTTVVRDFDDMRGLKARSSSSEGKGGDLQRVA